MALLIHIKAIHAETKAAYGWPRIWRELRQRHVRVSGFRRLTVHYERRADIHQAFSTLAYTMTAFKQVERFC